MSEEKITYYTILNLQETATVDEIKKAYRGKVLSLHPDKNPDPSAAKKDEWQKVQDAYDVLGDPAKKKTYDQQLAMGVELDLENITNANTRNLFRDILSKLDGKAFTNKIKEFLDTFEQTFRESQKASMRFFLECLFGFEAFAAGWKDAYDSKIQQNIMKFETHPEFYTTGDASVFDAGKFEKYTTKLGEQNEKQQYRMNDIRQEYNRMLQRFSKAYVLWAASESLSWFKRYQGIQSGASIRLYNITDPAVNLNPFILGKVSFSFTLGNRDVVLDGDEVKSLFSNFFHGLVAISGGDKIEKDYNVVGHIIAVSISPNLATKSIEQILDNFPPEARSASGVADLLLLESSEPSHPAFSPQFFKSEPTETGKKQETEVQKNQQQLEDLKRKLLLYIEGRAHGAVYTGSRLGFDRQTKLDAAEELFKVMFLDKSPNDLFANDEWVDALKQGKLGDIAASTLTNLKERSSPSPHP